jgi:hypothetical protein
VRLQPAATAKGIVVDDKDRPIEGGQIIPSIVLERGNEELKEQDFFETGRTTFYSMFTDEPIKASDPAEFTYDNLIPGVRYYVQVSRDGGSYHPIPALKPGEVRDLGRITHKPENQ